MDIDERIRLALGERHDICLAYLFGSYRLMSQQQGRDSPSLTSILLLG
jgi:hypothetical protein